MVPTSAMSAYVIGDPGRAAAEVGAGVPVRRPWCPDIVADATDVPGLTVRAASTRGVLHRKYGTPRQDSYSLSWQHDSTELFVTVCDGVGSLEMSQDAAEWVTLRMAEAVRRDESGILDWQAAFTTLSAELAELAAVRGPMATTVVSACVTPVDNRFQAEIAWVGDSAAYLLGPVGWEVVGGSVKAADPDGAPLVTTTLALPSRVVEAQTAVVEFGCDTALFLMTDGLADPLGAGAGEVGHTLASWWAIPPDPFTLAAQAAFARRSFDDDRTVVGVWPATGAQAQ
ncbi:protein phosphatase 2C domain-containing protein [Mycolicibacterium llatzerense]|uniref:protein phosphatase 2C domain-containing protein n=1 Tax=Mycolicibacterium llatzerense TaxID=280871 RepID=UPI0008DCAA63|nr:protein phosphatase 2C domain-containing protein [Mycolicibacterium llatzerense]